LGVAEEGGHLETHTRQQKEGIDLSDEVSHLAGPRQLGYHQILDDEGQDE
jgi:hypothetical protein